MCLEHKFGEDVQMQVFGVCDGHGPQGRRVSQWVKKSTPKAIEKQLLKIKNIKDLNEYQ